MNLNILKRCIFSLAVIIWGVSLVYFYASGRIVRYLAEDFHMWTLLGGMGLCVMGLFTLLTAADGETAGTCDHDHHENEGCDHDHDHDHSDVHPLVAMALVLLPLVGSVFATQDELSFAALERKAPDQAPETSSFFEELPPYTREYLEDTRAKTSDGYFEMPLLEVYFGTDNEEMREVLDGLPVALEGRLMPERENNKEGKRIRLFRMMRNCCAADSRIIPLSLEFAAQAPEFQPKSWALVKGELSYENIGGRSLPYLKVSRFEEREAPRNEAMGRDLPGIFQSDR